MPSWLLSVQELRAVGRLARTASREAPTSQIFGGATAGYTIERPINQRSDGDCALSLSTPVASRNGHVGHTARPYGSGSRRTATGAPDPPSLRLTRMGSCWIVTETHSLPRSRTKMHR